MPRLAVIDLVALDRRVLARMPRLRGLADAGTVHRIVPPLPAVTCTVQSSMLTGLDPAGHGIVGNGWYDRTSAEVRFWKQSNRLVAGEKAWETARRRDPACTCAKLFWWFNMYSSADVAVTPRPMYPADGRKIPDVHTHPADLRDRLQAELGRFPLFSFWGPAASIASSRWIADAARIVEAEHRPSLSLVYLPHLDYGLQKLGPDDPGIDAEARAIDDVAADLVEDLRGHGDVRVMIVGEYGIEPVTDAVWINRHLRDEGALALRLELGREMLDPGASRAFAVADHQVAHLYVRDPAETAQWALWAAETHGVGAALHGEQRRAAGLDHERAGDVVLVAEPGRWFAYGWWHDDARAPDYARTVDIHRKPGYDPLELFLDPDRAMVKARLFWKLGLRTLGFRSLLDVIPLRTDLVRGSHGRADMPEDRQPLLIAEAPVAEDEVIDARRMRDVMLDQLGLR